MRLLFTLSLRKKKLAYFSCYFNNIIVRRMQDITRFFNQSLKRDLSNNSIGGETSKKPKERSLSTSMSNDIPHDFFTETLKDSECVTILLNCIKKLKKQIIHIYSITPTN